jgi:NADP-dependent 3-hydroxy acid dehydrogenase YdfG
MESKNIIITGASRGIGKAIAAAFVRENVKLFLCARNEDALQKTVAELQLLNTASIIKSKVADVSKKEEAIEFGKWCLEFGTPDILINNAGMFMPGSIYNEKDGVLDKMIETNLYAAYHVTRTVVGKMIDAKKGHIFNICSIAALKAYDSGGSYSISKFALMGFSKNLREELKPYHIKVTTVYPGAVLTDSWGDYDNSSKRILEVEDIADMIVAASKLSPQAVVEDIVLRPQLGDL